MPHDIPQYPDASPINTAMRPYLHPQFQQLPDGISEFTFANLYLFRQAHQYRISVLGDLPVILGSDDQPFFMLPFGLPYKTALDTLFTDHRQMKAVPESQAAQLTEMGYTVTEDRDNFDYLYSREKLATLSGRKFHKKKNLVNLLVKNTECVAKPLLEEYTPHALHILDQWRNGQQDDGDYSAAREALERMEELQLCGGIAYVNNEPAAYCFGEEIALGKTYVIHFEKAVVTDNLKGIYQYINQIFATVLPDKYETINREQDLGDPGLRQAKESYRPIAFVKKYRARKE